MKQAEHDLRGLRCPMPIVQIFKILRDMAPGDECICVADDPAFCPDVAAWCRKTSNELVKCEKTPQGTRVVIRKCEQESVGDSE